MKYLLDTHVMLWFLEDSPELSTKSRRILKNAEHELFWSVVSYWELSVKFSLGRLELDKEWPALLEREKKVNRIQDLPLYQKHCEPHLNLPWHHKDPFDRLLICQAMVENMILMTKDRHIKKYKVKTVW
ncbi:MAG: type II toxin-antitoxin system VapC family toxin [Nitrospinae bacterium]|nr:type II toxin-antitoxin system VapC family toxin [Nitrospinota bacterium]